jgi:hypothetical protein
MITLVALIAPYNEDSTFDPRVGAREDLCRLRIQHGAFQDSALDSDPPIRCNHDGVNIVGTSSQLWTGYAGLYAILRLPDADPITRWLLGQQHHWHGVSTGLNHSDERSAINWSSGGRPRQYLYRVTGIHHIALVINGEPGFASTWLRLADGPGDAMQQIRAAERQFHSREWSGWLWEQRPAYVRQLPRQSVAREAAMQRAAPDRYFERTLALRAADQIRF